MRFKRARRGCVAAPPAPRGSASWRGFPLLLGNGAGRRGAPAVGAVLPVVGGIELEHRARVSRMRVVHQRVVADHACRGKGGRACESALTVAGLEISRRGVRRRRDRPSRESLRSNPRGITYARSRGDERVDSRGEGVGGARATPRSWGANSEVEKRACHHDLVVVLVRTLARGRSLANLTIDLHLPDVVVLILATVQEVHDLDIPGHVARAVGGSQRGKTGTPLSHLVFRLVTALSSSGRFSRIALARARPRFQLCRGKTVPSSTARFYSRIRVYRRCSRFPEIR